jgi:hypothetical protein
MPAANTFERLFDTLLRRATAATLQGSLELNPGGLPYGFFHQPAGRLAPGYPLVLDTHLSAKRAEQAITYIRDGGYLSETLTKCARVARLGAGACMWAYMAWRSTCGWGLM